MGTNVLRYKCLEDFAWNSDITSALEACIINECLAMIQMDIPFLLNEQLLKVGHPPRSSHTYLVLLSPFLKVIHTLLRVSSLLASKMSSTTSS